MGKTVFILQRVWFLLGVDYENAAYKQRKTEDMIDVGESFKGKIDEARTKPTILTSRERSELVLV